MPIDDRHVVVFDSGIERVSRNRLHHHQRRGVGIEFKERQDAVEQIPDRNAVRTQNLWAERVSRKMRIGKHYFISMTHLVQDE